MTIIEVIIFIIVIVVLISYYYWTQTDPELTKLWIDHAYWTRIYMISELNNLASKNIDTLRLLRNQNDLARQIAKRYGGFTKTKALLIEHVQIVSEIIKSAKNGLNLDLLKQEWITNAQRIARHLSIISGKNYTLIETILVKHLVLTEKELNMLLNEEWTKSVEVFDEARLQILELADL